jgi:ubiquinone/menaquinone biosynthesis C-methylase UbiE
VACGPGLVACEVAKVARHVTGVDLTRAMIEQAEARLRSLGLTNLTWTVGDAQPLALPDATFSWVITRYTFHHFTDPAGVFAEMVRVCRPGGRVTVCEVFTTSAKQAEAYDRLERDRDPSHTHALQLADLEALFSRLQAVRREFYKYSVAVEDLLSRSFPDAGGAESFRRTIEADVGVNRLGIDASRDGGLRFAFPVVILSGVKPLARTSHWIRLARAKMRWNSPRAIRIRCQISRGEAGHQPAPEFGRAVQGRGVRADRLDACPGNVDVESPSPGAGPSIGM